MPQFTESGIDKNQPLFDLVVNYAQQKNATPAQIALAWVLAKKRFIVPIPGTRKPDRLAENCGSADIVLSEAEIEAIDKVLDTLPPQDAFTGAK